MNWIHGDFEKKFIEIMKRLENKITRKIDLMLKILVLFFISCNKDSKEQINLTSLQYLHIKTEAYDINNNKLGELFLPIDSNGTYYYFNHLILRCVVVCDANSATLPHNYCLLPSQIDSSYFPNMASVTTWSFTSTLDTIKGVIYNPGDTVYFPLVDRFEIYLVKSNYLPADSTKCN